MKDSDIGPALPVTGNLDRRNSPGGDLIENKDVCPALPALCTLNRKKKTLVRKCHETLRRVPCFAHLV